MKNAHQKAPAKQARQPTRRQLPLAAACILVVAASLGMSLLINAADMRDSDGRLFALLGREILNGKIPYRDLWDHKPPGIFYLSALGSAMFDRPQFWRRFEHNRLLGALADPYSSALLFETLWAVMWLTVCWALLRWICRRGGPHQNQQPSWPATDALALLAWQHSRLFFRQGGNYIESYMLLLEIAAVMLLLLAWQQGRKLWIYAAAVSFTGAMLLKPNAVLIPVLLSLLLLAWAWRAGQLRDAARMLALLAATIVVLLGLVAAAMAAAGILKQAWYATITYNLHYLSRAGTEKHLAERLANLLFILSQAPVLSLAAAGAVIGAATRVLLRSSATAKPPSKKASQPPYLERPDAVLIGVVWLTATVADYLLTAVYPSAHYAIPALAPLTLLACCGLTMAGSVVARLGRRMRWAATLAMIAAGGWVLSPGVRRQLTYLQQSFGISASNAPWRKPCDYIRRHSDPRDSIWVWAYSPSIYLCSNRTSGSRFVFNRPFLQAAPELPELAQKLLEDLQSSKPKFIIIRWERTDASATWRLVDPQVISRKWPPALRAAARVLLPVRRFIRRNYFLRRNFAVTPDWGWRLYQRRRQISDRSAPSGVSPPLRENAVASHGAIQRVPLPHAAPWATSSPKLSRRNASTRSSYSTGSVR